MRRNQFMIRLASAIAAAVCAFFCTSFVQAAEGKTYQVIYKAGNVGEFTPAYQEYAMETLGAVSADAKKIVYEVAPGTAFPQLPQAGNLSSDGYFAADASQWGPKEAAVTKRCEYVVQYEKLADAVEYTVKFVDAASGEQIALPEIAMGNVGAEVTYTAKTIPDYRLMSAGEAVLVLEKDASCNVILFSYESTKPPAIEEVIRTEYVDGDITIEYVERENVIYQQSSTVRPGRSDAQPEDGNEGQQEQNDVSLENNHVQPEEEGNGNPEGNENIEEEPVPLDNGSGQEEGEDVTVILEEDTPLAKENFWQGKGALALGSAAGAGAAAMTLGGIWLWRKRKGK